MSFPFCFKASSKSSQSSEPWEVPIHLVGWKRLCSFLASALLWLLGASTLSFPSSVTPIPIFMARLLCARSSPQPCLHSTRPCPHCTDEDLSVAGLSDLLQVRSVTGRVDTNPDERAPLILCPLWPETSHYRVWGTPGWASTAATLGRSPPCDLFSLRFPGYSPFQNAGLSDSHLRPLASAEVKNKVFVSIRLIAQTPSNPHYRQPNYFEIQHIILSNN